MPILFCVLSAICLLSWHTEGNFVQYIVGFLLAIVYAGFFNLFSILFYYFHSKIQAYSGFLITMLLFFSFHYLPKEWTGIALAIYLYYWGSVLLVWLFTRGIRYLKKKKADH